MTNQKLKVVNESGSSYVFFVDNKNMKVEAITTSGKTYLFGVKIKTTVVGGKLKTSCGVELPITSMQNEIIEFLKNAKTREMLSFESKEEAESFKEKESNCGDIFFSMNTYNVYVYN